jgi:hypothetical protein
MASKGNKEQNSNQKFGPVPHNKASTDHNREMDRLKSDPEHVQKNCLTPGDLVSPKAVKVAF